MTTQMRRAIQFKDDPKRTEVKALLPQHAKFVARTFPDVVSFFDENDHEIGRVGLGLTDKEFVVIYAPALPWSASDLAKLEKEMI